MKLNKPFKIKLKKFKDKRGFLSEIISQKKLKLNFKHSIISVSKKNVIRGLHFRTKPEYKIMYLVKGEINDHCVNLINKKKYKFNLKENECLLIPPGYAHGYECIKKHNILIYFLSWPYNPKLQSGIIYNDKQLKIKWSIKKPIISKRDQNLKNFNLIKSKKYY